MRSTYIAFVDKLEGLLEEVLDDADISYAWVSARSENRTGFGMSLARARRAGIPLGNPLESRLQPAGVVVVTYRSGATAAVADVLSRELEIHLDESDLPDDVAARNERLADLGQEGDARYAYPRFLVSLDERRQDLTEWRPYVGLRANVEVLTLFQYAWSRLDTDLPFYEFTSYPAETRDALRHSAADLAALDERLVDVKSELQRFGLEYEQAISGGDFALPLNGTSLTAYLRVSETVHGLVETAIEAGMTEDRDYEATTVTVEGGPLWVLQRLGFTTIAEVEELLQSATPRAAAILGDIARISAERGFDPWAVPDSIVEWLALVLRRADGETVLLLDYTDEIEAAVNTLIGNPARAADPDEA
jgi:hypothetical protein